jgi:hypothetical protein
MFRLSKCIDSRNTCTCSIVTGITSECRTILMFRARTQMPTVSGTEWQREKKNFPWNIYECSKQQHMCQLSLEQNESQNIQDVYMFCTEKIDAVSTRAEEQSVVSL